MTSRRGGPRFEEVCVKLEKKHFRIINAVCGGDQRKISKVVRNLIAEALKDKQISDLLELANPPIRKKKEEGEAGE